MAARPPPGAACDTGTPRRDARGTTHGTNDHQEDDVHATLIAAAEQATEHAALPFPPLVYGLGAFAGLVAMLLATYAFRSVGTRH